MCWIRFIKPKREQVFYERNERGLGCHKEAEILCLLAFIYNGLSNILSCDYHRLLMEHKVVTCAASFIIDEQNDRNDMQRSAGLLTRQDHWTPRPTEPEHPSERWLSDLWWAKKVLIGADWLQKRWEFVRQHDHTLITPGHYWLCMWISMAVIRVDVNWDWLAVDITIQEPAESWHATISCVSLTHAFLCDRHIHPLKYVCSERFVRRGVVRKFCGSTHFLLIKLQ